MSAWPGATGTALPPCPGQHPAFPAGTSNLLYWPTCLTSTSCHPWPCRVPLWLQCLWGGDVVPMPHTLLGVPRGDLGTPTLGSGGHGAHLFPWGQVVICCLWLLLGMHYDLPCQLFHWHCCTCCPSSCCPLCCPAARTGRAPTALSPLPSWPPGSCSDAFAFSVAIETQEWDEKTGSSVGLWAGLGVGQWAGWLLGAGLNRARQCQQLPSRPDSTLVSAVGSIATNGNLFWWHWQIRQWPGAVGRKVIYQSQHGEEPHFAPALCPHEHSRSTVALVGGICRLLPADPFIPACLT